MPRREKIEIVHVNAYGVVIDRAAQLPAEIESRKSQVRDIRRVSIPAYYRYYIRGGRRSSARIDKKRAPRPATFL